LGASNGFAPFHRNGWDISGGMDLAPASSERQAPVYFGIISVAFDPDLLK